MKLKTFIRIYSQILLTTAKTVRNQFASAIHWSRMDVSRAAFIENRVFLTGNGLVTVKSGAQLKRNTTFEVREASSQILVEEGAIIEEGVKIRCFGNGKITIGKEARINKNASLSCAGNGQIEIGNQVYIGENVNIYSNAKVLISSNSFVQRFTSISPREDCGNGNFEVGRNCHIHEFNFFDTTASIVFGDEVRTGPYDIFYTHDHSVNGGGSIWDKPIKMESIQIQNNAWIGSHVTLLPGVQIGEGAVVAAGAVVTSPVEQYNVVAGIPARILYNRLTK